MPLAVASPFFRSIDLAARGVEMIHPEAPVAHALDGGRAAVLERSVAATAAGLGADPAAGRGWRRLFGHLVNDADKLGAELLGPVVHRPRHPLALARFGLPALQSATRLARTALRGDDAQALFGGLAAHSMVDLGRPLSASFGLVLGPVRPRRRLADGPRRNGGDRRRPRGRAARPRRRDRDRSPGDPARATCRRSRVILLDVTPRAALALAGDGLPGRTRRAYERFRYGSGVFKLDWALDGPIPWAAEGARRAATVHLGGTLEEVAAGEHEVAGGGHPERPFVIVVQYAPWDPSRAPAGKTTAWAYCHVPAGSTIDMTARIEAQVERFAPGFRDLVLARSVRGPAAMEAHNPNYVGGDINAGVQDIRQLLFRPRVSLDPYWTGAPGLYLCSSSTAPGGGAHGMSGYHAARSALRRDLR